MLLRKRRSVPSSRRAQRPREIGSNSRVAGSGTALCPANGLAQRIFAEAGEINNRTAREVEPRIKSQLTLTALLNRLRMGTGGTTMPTQITLFSQYEICMHFCGGVDAAKQ